MGFFYISLIAIVQGITEFLPVSSSGHLLLLSELFKKPEQTLQVDVAVHFGTLLAILLFYKRDFLLLLSGIHKNICLKFDDRDAQFLHLIIVATLPVICLGLFLSTSGLIYEMRSIKIVGWGMIVFGIILFMADRYGKGHRAKNSWSFRDAFIMGLWQACSLIPGTSRSGNTITGAMFLGFSRESSVHLSLIMSVPTIMASSVLLLIDLIKVDFMGSDPKILFFSCCFSFLVASLTLTVFVKFVKNNTFTPFVIYRMIIGSLILYIAYN